MIFEKRCAIPRNVRHRGISLYSLSLGKTKLLKHSKQLRLPIFDRQDCKRQFQELYQEY